MPQVTTPLVSVIVPLYNMEDYIEETLLSILASDYTNFEVIVIDDGSKDTSLEIVHNIEKRDSRLKVFTQPNGGVCRARNNAISHSKGEYILPIDADDLISPHFISLAVAAMHDDVKVVCPKAEFFGDRTGEWKLKPFSLHLLARKNMMAACALFRRADWERVGGYCEEIIAREDWEFWIAILKDGGRVVKLSETTLWYRIRSGSKRQSDRKLKRHVIDILNQRHPDFFYRELGGKLHYHRSWSRLLNRINRFFYLRHSISNPSLSPQVANFVATLPETFDHGTDIIYQGRNILKRFQIEDKTYIVKSYCIPHLANRIIYRLFRPSKAERAYRYGVRLQSINIGTPQPVGYTTCGSWFLLGRSFSVTEESVCTYTFRHFADHTFDNRDDILRAIARTTARLHDNGWIHKDYSAGNILFRTLPNGEIDVEIIDLNRMRFHSVTLEEGCRNFERLPGTIDMYQVLAEEYAHQRNFNVEKCMSLITTACRKSGKFIE